MPFLLMYWKQLAVIGAVIILLPITYYKGFEAGKDKVQAEWNQQQVLDAQAVAIADNKTIATNINSQKVTQDENLNLKQNLSSNNDYYSHHLVAGTSYGVFKPAVTKADSSEMPIVPDTSKQPDDQTANAVSRADYEKLANDCLATTLQLDNAQEWAIQQVKINAE